MVSRAWPDFGAVHMTWGAINELTALTVYHRLKRYLLAGDAGRAAARKVDDTIRKLPGFETAPLLEAWMDRHVRHGHGVNGGRNGHGHD